MASTFHCDCCGKITYLNPPTKQVMEDKEVTVQYQDVAMVDEKPIMVLKTKTVIQSVPATTIMRRQHHQSGDVEEVQIPLIEDLKPRTYIVRLSIGGELIQKDFCKECIEKPNIKSAIKMLWDSLAAIKSVE